MKQLYRRRDLVEKIGLPYGQVDRLLRAGVLKGQKVAGRGRNHYHKDEIERVFQVKL
jgi:hypothetical protein